MGQQLLRGSTQLQPGTVTWDRMASGAIVPTTSLVDTFLLANGSVAATGALNLSTFGGTSSKVPSSANDLVNKSYVDSIKSGFQLHFAKVVAIANSALTGLLTIDGVTLSAGNIALLTAQTTGAQNGLWLVASGSWTRPPEWAAASTLPEGQYVIIDADGTTFKNTKWFCTNTSSIVVDTTAATFSQDTSGTSYSNGSGLSLTGTVFAVKTGNGVTIDGSSNVAAAPNATKLIEVTSSGIGIINGTAGQIMLANASGNASYAAMSGDATISSGGAVTLAATVMKYASIIKNEVPSGTVNGSNVTFTLANTPQAGSVTFTVNGLIQKPLAGGDYTISGNTITTLNAPLAGDQLLVDYFK